MSNRLLVPREKRFFLPSLIIPRSVLRYRGIWNGAEDFHGALLVEGRKGLEWVSLQYLFDGGWDGQPPTEAMLSHAIGLWAASAGVAVVPGSQTWTSNGSHSVTAYNRLEVAVWGGGGGGGGVWPSGAGSVGASNGGQSKYASSTNVIANGGGGGKSCSGSSNGGSSSGGTASGGDANTSGTGGTAGGTSSGSGGAAASGSGTILGTLTGGGTTAGRGSNGNGASGAIPGAGGAGGKNSTGDAGGGGGGALAVKLWDGMGASGAPQVGETITVTRGNGSSGASGYNQDDPQVLAIASGGTGGRGEIRAQWD